jgi:hypothetical protein
LMWDNLGECVDRQLDELVEAYQDIDQPLGTLPYARQLLRRESRGRCARRRVIR